MIYALYCISCIITGIALAKFGVGNDCLYLIITINIGISIGVGRKLQSKKYEERLYSSFDMRQFLNLLNACDIRMNVHKDDMGVVIELGKDRFGVRISISENVLPELCGPHLENMLLNHSEQLMKYCEEEKGD